MNRLKSLNRLTPHRGLTIHEVCISKILVFSFLFEIFGNRWKNFKIYNFPEINPQSIIILLSSIHRRDFHVLNLMRKFHNFYLRHTSKIFHFPSLICRILTKLLYLVICILNTSYIVSQCHSLWIRTE